jgi:hypothetical protein
LISRNHHRPIIALAFTGFILGFLALHAAGDINWQHFWHKVFITVLLMNDHVLPCFVLAGSLISWKRTYRTALAIAVIALLNGSLAAVAYDMRGASGESSAPMIVTMLSSTSLPFCLITLALLCAQPLRGAGNGVRISGIALLATFYVMYFAAIPFPVLMRPFWVYIGRAIVGAAAFLTVLWVSWAIPFYSPARADRTPADASTET